MSAVTNDYKLGALQTTKMYPLMVLKAGGLKSKCMQHTTLRPEHLGRTLPCLFWLLTVAHNPQHCLACGCVTPVSASSSRAFFPEHPSLCPDFLLVNTSIIKLGLTIAAVQARLN